MGADWEDELQEEWEPSDEENLIILTDDEGEDVPFICLANVDLHDKHYAVLADAEDEDSVMIFLTEEDENGDISYQPVEDEDECDEVFYIFQAEIEDYDFGPAT